MQGKFILTRHVKERFVQRFGDQLAKDIAKDDRLLNHEVLMRLQDGAEEKSYLNNSHFMEHLMTKYGFNTKFCFIIYNKRCVFVANEVAHKVYHVKTCYDAMDGRIFANVAQRTHYNKISREKTPA